MPSIDFSQIESLEPVDPGTYLATIVHAEEGEAKTSGQPKIDIRWKISGGENDGRQVFDTLSFHPSALWRTKKSLIALGFDEDFEGDVEAELLINLEATIVVSREASDGMDPATGQPYPERNRVLRILPASASVTGFLQD